MKNLIKSKDIHTFGLKKTGILMFDRSFSNIFVTLLDSQKRVVVCKTSGSVHVGDSKKKKSSSQAVEKILVSIFNYLKLYGIRELRIVLKVRISIHVHTLLKELLYNGYHIVGFEDWKKIAHNGVRQRKLRRV